uniref:Small ribosomal subunit protein uS9c n=1 Tax=Araucaria cunninghamii TaxID=56994 RepID=A0A0D6QY29_ARACU
MANAVAISSLVASFSSLALSQNSSTKSLPNKSLLGTPLKTKHFNFHLKISISRERNAAPIPIPAIRMAAAAQAGLEKQDLTKYVKSRLPGGFAAQRVIGTGRRKTAVARVVLLEGNGQVIINNRTAQEYLQGNPLWLQYLKYPLASLGYETKYDVFVKAQGGGLSGQAQAIALGIARALLKANPGNREPLAKQGLLTRDARMVERKKAGLHKARKAPQYSKR